MTEQRTVKLLPPRGKLRLSWRERAGEYSYACEANCALCGAESVRGERWYAERERSLRREGWSKTSLFGWICPACKSMPRPRIDYGYR